MSIYTKNNHRKIYKQHYGTIPKDETGRTYDIHHIDGNHFNNDPVNLKAVTIQEHYEIHYAQGDWAACLIMSDRMKISPEEKSILAKKSALKLVNEGRHNFLGGSIQSKTAQRLLANGTHNLLGDNNPAKKLYEDGTHPFIGGNNNRSRVTAGTHPSQSKVSCLCCHKTIDKPNYSKYHGPKCKLFFA